MMIFAKEMKKLRRISKLQELPKVRRATSVKLQAASVKPQATSFKLQAASDKLHDP
jgi:hypothetical protein